MTSARSFRYLRRSTSAGGGLFRPPGPPTHRALLADTRTAPATPAAFPTIARNAHPAAESGSGGLFRVTGEAAS